MFLLLTRCYKRRLTRFKNIFTPIRIHIADGNRRSTKKVIANANGFNRTIINETGAKIQKDIKNQGHLRRITTLDARKEI